jgi:hypothetical protein
MFKILYNWLKFKTLPPSILFTNRLYLERESKTRKITTNLGLTFRNSKWSEYLRTDINPNLKSLWLLGLFWPLPFVIIFFIFWQVAYLYNVTWLSNTTSYFIWSFKDTSAYWFFTLLTLISLQWTSLVEFVYKNFIGWLFLKSSLSNPRHERPNPLVLAIQDRKYLFFRWLTQKNNNSIAKILPHIDFSRDKKIQLENFVPLLKNFYMLLFELQQFEMIPIFTSPNTLSSKFIFFTAW